MKLAIVFLPRDYLKEMALIDQGHKKALVLFSKGTKGRTSISTSPNQSQGSKTSLQVETVGSHPSSYISSFIEAQNS